jgi:hypothetical protein
MYLTTTITSILLCKSLLKVTSNVICVYCCEAIPFCSLYWLPVTSGGWWHDCFIIPWEGILIWIMSHCCTRWKAGSSPTRLPAGWVDADGLRTEEMWNASRWTPTYEFSRNQQFIFTNIAQTNKLRVPIHLANTDPCIYILTNSMIYVMKRINSTYEHSTYKYTSRNTLCLYTGVHLRRQRNIYVYDPRFRKHCYHKYWLLG